MITENLDLFFADFGVSFVAGAVSGMCIKDQPGINILGDQVIQVDYQVIVKSSLFGGLLYNDIVSVEDKLFTVKEAMPLEDGVFSLINLEPVIGETGLALKAKDGRILIARSAP